MIEAELGSAAAEAAGTGPSPRTRLGARRILMALLYFVIAFFLAISFVSYDGTSPISEKSAFANLCGVAGVATSEFLLRPFGAGAFVIAIFCLFVGYTLLAGRSIHSPLVKCLGALVATASLAALTQSFDPTAGYAKSSYLIGGIVGDLMASTLHVWFGGLGALLIIILLLLSSVVMATDSFLFELAATLPALLSGTRRGRIAVPAPASADATSVTGEDETAAAAAKKPRRRRRTVAAEATEPAGDAVAVLEDPLATFADIGDLAPALTEIPEKEEKAEKKAARGRRRREAPEEAEATAAVPSEVASAAAEADEGIAALVWPEADPAEEEAPARRPAGRRRGARDVEEVRAADDSSRPSSDEDEDAPSEEIETQAFDDADPEPGESADDGAVDAEEEGAFSGPRLEPVIRRAVAPSDDGIEIMRISRAKHLEGREMYALPPLTLLDEIDRSNVDDRDAEIKAKALKIEETLDTFGIKGRVVEISRGPTITVYEVELSAGTKVKRITSLPDDLSMALRAKTIRIVAPIPGKSTVGIEVPNDIRERVTLRELALSEVLRRKTFHIPLFLGKDASGEPLIEDLTQMPHLLIAGQTGSGKSVCINSVIASLLMTKYPEEVRLILIDPKMVELQAFRDVPHLLTPVVTDMKKAPKVLDWAVNEMEQRYELLSAASVRDIEGFNALGVDEVKSRLSEHLSPGEVDELATSLPYVVVVVDELADLMMTSAKEVETSICRLAQKSRAVGIHVILATQRPSVDVITGLIKSNMPSRISFRTASKIDSRTILDQQGAERLLGRGDMLFTAPRSSGPIRCQAALVTDAEIKNLVRYVKDVAQGQYSQELTQVRSTEEGPEGEFGERDPLYEEAIRAVLASQRGSVSMLQRKLEIGYTRAARLIDFMAEDGLVGNFKGSKAREVLKTLEEWDRERGAEA